MHFVRVTLERTNRRTLLGAFALVACAIALVVGLRWLAAPTIASHERTIAVLAFTTGAPQQRTAQADALRGQLARALGALSGVQVVGGDRPVESAMLALRPREVGATLGARLVVSGTLDTAGQITIRLIEVEVGDQLYEESVVLGADPEAAVARIVAGIAKALDVPAHTSDAGAAPSAGPAPPRSPD